VFYFETFYFNIGIVWLSSLLLYVTLYFETFRKAFSIFGKIDLSFVMEWLSILKGKGLETIRKWRVKKPVPVMESTAAE
jgi:hypothetical protein